MIAILAKAPVPGFCKTRLIPQLGAAGAARLQARLTEKTVMTALSANIGPVTLFCTPEIQHAHFLRLKRRYKIQLRRQSGRDLGARMLQAMRFALASHERVIVLGTDAPALTASQLKEAAQQLVHHAVVIQPAFDGGYVLIGARQADPGYFRRITWGGSRVMQATRDRLESAGSDYMELPVLWDLDDIQDLRRAREEGLI